MKKFIKFSALILAAAALVSNCTTEELCTDQFSDQGLMFSAFAPNPVFRGGELTILGSNLDQVKEVLIPGVDAIKEFKVTGSGRQCKLTLTVPVDGPEVGNISIVGQNGEMLTSKAELTYTEPIVFTSFSPANAMPGDIITIKGDYLNLVNEVIFENGVIVNEFKSRSRYEMSVKVPSQAITGRLIVGDSDELLDPDTIANKVYSDGELVIGDPTVNEADKQTVKYEDEITVTGKYLDMISTLNVGGTFVSDFTLNDDNTALTFAVPALATDGEIVLTDYAGKDFNAGEIETVIPTGLEAAPQPVKADDDLVISGEDLDLVDAVELPGAGEQAFAYDVETGDITVVMSPKATEGDATLKLANGKSVTVAFTLVKPVVTAVDPLQLMAGEDITVTGSDLDLITGATLGGKDVEFKMSDDGKSLILTTNKSSVSGKIVLTLANGTTVEPEDEITLSYDSFIIVNDMPTAEHIGNVVTLKGENFMMIENIFIGDAKVTTYLSRTPDEISFIMPYNKVGVYNMHFDLLSGERETCPQSIEVQLELKIITGWEGEVEIQWNENGRPTIPASCFLDVTPGTIMRVFYTQKDQVWAQAQFNYGNWTGIDFNKAAEGCITFKGELVPTNHYGWFEDGVLDRCSQMVLTKEILDNIQALKGECDGKSGCGIIIQGSDLIFHKVEIVQEIPQEKTIWTGEAIADAWGNQPYVMDDAAGAELGIVEGTTVRVYFEKIRPADNLLLELVEGHWGPTYWSVCSYGTADPEPKYVVLDEGATYYDLYVTAEIAEAAAKKGGWGGIFVLNGDNAKVTKITLL